MKSMRNSILAMAAALLLATGAPVTAEAGSKSYGKHRSGPHQIANKLERIHDDVSHLRKIKSPFRRDEKIDALQWRLHKLEKRSNRQRGRKARYNDDYIDDLQYKLRRIEKRNNKRLRVARAERRKAEVRRDRIRAQRERYRDDRYRARHDPEYYAQRRGRWSNER